MAGLPEAASRPEGAEWLRKAQRLKRQLSPSAHLRVLREALSGTPRARRRHAEHTATPATVEAGLAAIARRWPSLASPQTSEPIFILSTGWRCGSTFLQRWLMKDTDILIWGEPYRYSQPIHLLARQVSAFAQAGWPPDFFFADQYSDEADFTQEFVANLYPSMEEFLGAHIAYFERLFVAPAARFNRARWGLKEVSLTVDDACYLKWLFPKARFIFLYRSPYHAYRSYRQWRDWYRSWPDEPIFTATSFGKWWKELTADFVRHHEKVGGLLVQYETISKPETRKRLEDYLGVTLADPSSLPRVRNLVERDATGDDNRWVPKVERFLLKRAIEPVGTELGYRQL
jgi:sulfotransferase family protein